MKLCECGCGQPARFFTRTQNKRGESAGSYGQYAAFHKPRQSRPVGPRTNRAEVFSARVATIPDANGCLLWLGGRIPGGYGSFAIGRRTITAHRYAYMRRHGAIPIGMGVLHKCDVPLCVNPDHLFLGTNADNCADKIAKGRQIVGEQVKNALLTARSVLEIRRSSAVGRILAEKYGVSRSLISLVKRGRAWAHVKDIKETA